MAEFERMIRERFPVRKSRKQKKAFEEEALRLMRDLGYEPSVETGGFFKSRNIVAGDPESAAVVVCADYDTAARKCLPDLGFPQRPWLDILWQALCVLVLLVLSFAVYVAAWLMVGAAARPVFFSAFILFALLQVAGPPEKRNASSDRALAVLLEVMEGLEKEKRDRAAFVLFDNGGLFHLGARTFARAYPRAQYLKLAVQIGPLTGDGRLAVIPRKMARKATGYHALARHMQQVGAMEGSLLSAAALLVRGSFSAFACGVLLESGAWHPLTGCVVSPGGRGKLGETEQTALAGALLGTLRGVHTG